MELRLRALIESISEPNRIEWARDWKEKGDRKVMGTICSYIPEEVLNVAGLLPYRILGT